MDNKPPFDRSLIPPLVFGAFSIFGICLVLLLARLSAFRSVTPVETTNTPFQFVLLGTEPGFTTLTPTDTPTLETETAGEGEPAEETATKKTTPTERPGRPPTRTASPTAEDDIISIASPTRTPASPSTPTPTTASNAPLNPGTYDDTDQRIDYIGNWVSQTNVSGVEKGTLHVSTTLDNSALFRFIGEQVRIFYQSGSSLGIIRINLDGLEYDLDESAGVVKQSEWVSPMLLNGTHILTISHLSGGSVNLDMVVIPDILKTPTPTP
ncbi:MAG: hypothetical protein IT313_12720 [Anaerolineales bacterium]|nr:hypothetical protein [Anaerolineales bacterium]